MLYQQRFIRAQLNIGDTIADDVSAPQTYHTPPEKFTWGKRHKKVAKGPPETVKSITIPRKQA